MASIIRFPDAPDRRLPPPQKMDRVMGQDARHGQGLGHGAEAWLSWFGATTSQSCAERSSPGHIDCRAPDAAPREGDLALEAEGLGNHYRAWFGRSGRRYIVTVHALDGADPACGYDGALLFAVRRDVGGRAVLLEGRDSGDADADGSNERWTLAMRERGATELHVHLLARDALARQRVLRDLTA